MHTRRQAILLTGFGPFPGVASNASAELVPRLAQAATRRLAGFKVLSAILPTEWRFGPRRLNELLEDHRPALALHFGVSSRTGGFAIEMRSRNLCSPANDAIGEAPVDACIAEGGPEFLPATLPVHHIVARLRQRGLPARVSRDAGGYLCNALLYHSLTFSRRNLGAMRVGFVHIPDALASRGSPSARRCRSGCQLDLEDAVEGGMEIIATSLGRAALPTQR